MLGQECVDIDKLYDFYNDVSFYRDNLMRLRSRRTLNDISYELELQDYQKEMIIYDLDKTIDYVEAILREIKKHINKLKEE